MISENSTDRVSDESYQVWDREEIIYFLEKRLGLSKDKKIKGRVVTHHNEALFYWKELIEDHKLLTPFEVIHVDSHADLGLGYPSWTFVMDSLLTMPVEKRMDMDNYSNVFEKYYEPSIGDYLLFAIAFRWITRLTYICNPAGMGDDYVWMILKDGVEPNDKIQLAHNENMKAMQINRNTKKYYETAVREPEVDFEIVRQMEKVKANLEHCVGMAANMIGVKKNIIVVAAGPFQFAMINPIITKKSGAYQTEEGCLSLKGVRPCTRYQEIEVDYLDQNFKKQYGKYSGWTAQIIQHEIDHCNGIVI